MIKLTHIKLLLKSINYIKSLYRRIKKYVLLFLLYRRFRILHSYLRRLITISNK